MSTTELLKKAKDAYYNGEEPIMSDEAYDALSGEESEVGYGKVGFVELPYRMYSLNKSYEGVPEYLNDTNNNFRTVNTPKLDGAAIAIVYKDGVFSGAYTRGDGIFGRDISNHIKVLIDKGVVPATISTGGEDDKPLVQITGEVVAKKVANTRNFISGALNTKEPELDKLEKLEFVAYGLFPYRTYHKYFTYTMDMDNLKQDGFSTIFDEKFESDEYPKDGRVVRINNNDIYTSLGNTAHHPRGAIALKETKEGQVTTLLDISWQVGRSGVVTPVAILQEVEIDGAKVTRASLHNKRYIQELGLDIGDRVEVIRAGDIIPQVIRKV